MNTTSVYKRLLYEGSLLIPRISYGELEYTASQIQPGKTWALVAMANGVLVARKNLQDQVLNQTTLFCQLFKINMDNFADFFLGFAMPNYVILACYNQPLGDADFGDDKELANRSDYILKASAQFTNKVSRAKGNTIPELATRIFTYCEKIPYVYNDYYYAGTAAGLMAMREFFTNIELIDKR